MAIRGGVTEAMQKMNLVANIISILLGSISVLFHSKLAQFSIKQWRESFPNTKVRETMYDTWFLWGGIAFIVLGLLSLFHII
jgi:hypothetical protein